MSSRTGTPISKEMQNNLALLFERPFEPTFFPKDNGKKVIVIPADFYDGQYERFAETVDISSRFDIIKPLTIKVKCNEIEVKPDLSFLDDIRKDEAFSLFLAKHQKISAKLTELFMKEPAETLFEFAAFCRDKTNPYLFQYSFSVALQHRDDTKGMPVSSALKLFPEQFVDATVMSRFREESRLGVDLREPVPIGMNFTANDKDYEERLAYFREDVGVNLHHWHWHLVYPGFLSYEIVNKDRRGELFYYMHSQLLARYNLERFTSHLPRFLNLVLTEPIDEAYFPKIIRSSKKTSYPPRFPGISLKDVDREETGVVLVDDLRNYIEKIRKVIATNTYIAEDGEVVELDEETGIDVLGNLVEASVLSKNKEHYGSLHNMGHDLISYVHDPDGRFKEEFSVMGEVTTAMRDPLFYRWHGVLDSLWVEYKDKLQPYPGDQLNFNGVTVTSFKTILEESPTDENQLFTFWSKTKLDMGAGMDFNAAGSMFAEFTHLNHGPFKYEIKVTSSRVQKGTCRIFLGPKTNERGNVIEFKEQRRLMIEMDKFTVNLKSGDNIISRKSLKSTVTIPFDRTFRPLNKADNKDSLCGCGFPQHMLLPRGSIGSKKKGKNPREGGTDYDIFVMISNYEHDKVDSESDESQGCNDAHSFCGIRGGKYPYKRMMGYPFDRVISAKTETLQDFAAEYTNMLTAKVNILFDPKKV
ncbi:unnamed protein product [Diamesa hyperborea]